MEKHGNPNQPQDVPYAPPKTVGVRDEAGNRYEATYMRRAKGLVKNGRARFADESQTEIILTCPPNQHLILEDKTMTEQMNNTQVTENETVVANENTVAEKNAPQLTAREIFDQIAILQRQIVESSYNALYRLTDATNGICGDGGFESDEAKGEAIESVARAFRMREETYQTMLEMYQQMYNDLCGDQKTDQICDKMQVISRSFKDHAAFIRDSDMDTDDKCDALKDISERIDNLISTVL